MLRHFWTLALLVALPAAAETFKADPKLDIVDGSASAAPSPAPEVKFISPEAMEIVPTHEQAFPAGSGTLMQVPCVLDPGKTVVKLSVKNWKMSPNGNGITLVVDNKVGMTVFDVSKPIPLADLLLKVGINGDCGWHFIAAFATLPSGESVKAESALAVSPLLFGGKSYAESAPVPDLVSKKIGLLVLNLRPLGKQIVTNGKVFFKPANPAKVMVDARLWNGPEAGLGNYRYHMSAKSSYDATSTDGKEYDSLIPRFVLNVPDSKGFGTDVNLGVNTFDINWGYNEVNVRLLNPQP